MMGFSTGASNPLSSMSDSDFQNLLNSTAANTARQNQLFAAAGMNTSGTSGSGSSSGSTTGSTSTSSDPFAIFGGLTGYTQTAEDASNFQLGQQENLSTFDQGLQNTSANQDQARTMQLNSQQDAFQQQLSDSQQNDTTQRLQMQLANQTQQQQADINEQNTFRAQSAALALRGLQ